jgi:hypothetical protein
MRRCRLWGLFEDALIHKYLTDHTFQMETYQGPQCIYNSDVDKLDRDLYWGQQAVSMKLSLNYRDFQHGNTHQFSTLYAMLYATKGSNTHYKQLLYEVQPEIPRGFVEGLTCQEFFLHQIPTREAMLAKREATPKSGTVAKRMAAWFNDVRVGHSGVVECLRDGQVCVLQLPMEVHTQSDQLPTVAYGCRTHYTFKWSPKPM